VSSVSNGLYFLTLPLVSVMRVIYREIRHARYLYIKRNVEEVWDVYIRCALSIEKYGICEKGKFKEPKMEQCVAS